MLFWPIVTNCCYSIAVCCWLCILQLLCLQWPETMWFVTSLYLYVLNIAVVFLYSVCNNVDWWVIPNVDVICGWWFWWLLMSVHPVQFTFLRLMQEATWNWKPELMVFFFHTAITVFLLWPFCVGYSFLAHSWMEWDNAVVRCPSSVCKHLCKSILLPDKCLDRHQTCTQWSPGGHASRVCSKSNSRSKVTGYGHFCDFTK